MEGARERQWVRREQMGGDITLGVSVASAANGDCPCLLVSSVLPQSVVQSSEAIMHVRAL